MPEVIVRNLLRGLMQVEQKMVHLQKLWKNDHQTRDDPPAGATGLPRVEEVFAFPLSGSLLMFSFSRASVSSTESTIFAEFYFSCVKKGIKRN